MVTGWIGDWLNGDWGTPRLWLGDYRKNTMVLGKKIALKGFISKYKTPVFTGVFLINEIFFIKNKLRFVYNFRQLIISVA